MCRLKVRFLPRSPKSPINKRVSAIRSENLAHREIWVYSGTHRQLRHHVIVAGRLQTTGVAVLSPQVFSTGSERPTMLTSASPALWPIKGYGVPEACYPSLANAGLGLLRVQFWRVFIFRGLAFGSGPAANFSVGTRVGVYEFRPFAVASGRVTKRGGWS